MGSGLELILKIIGFRGVVFELVWILQVGSVALYVKVPVQHTQISVSTDQYSSSVFPLVKHFADRIQFFLFFSIVLA
jgi:hypothetical protein